MDSASRQPRVLAFDIIRVVAMFWVVTFHFGYAYKELTSRVFNFFCYAKNFDFGNVAVTLFFALSGLLLYNRYGQRDNLSLRNFFVRRSMKIYPPFWLMNLYIVFTMARHWLAEGNPFFLGNPLKLLLTVLGIDGLAQAYGFQTYFFGGEWFIGAILLLYLLFPCLAAAYRRKPGLLLEVLLVGYTLQFLLPIDLDYYMNILPFTLVLKFVFGFVLAGSLEKMKNKVFLGSCFALAVLLLAIDIPGILKADFLGFVFALTIFPLLLFCGHLGEKSSFLHSVIGWLAAISYPAFLVQHVVIKWMQLLFQKVFGLWGMEFDAWVCFGLLWITFAVILVAALVLKWVTDKLVNRLPFPLLK